MLRTLHEAFALKGNPKAALFIYAFRLSHAFTGNRVLLFLGFPIRYLYHIFFQWILGIDIPDRTVIGRGFILFHGQGLVVNSATVIGKNVTLRQNTTIGNARPDGPCPVLDDHVEVGANCVIVGDVRIGDHAVIAAGSVVRKNIPPHTLVAGNPARVVKRMRSSASH